MRNLMKRLLSIAALATLLIICAAPVVRAQENATEPQDTSAGQVFRWLNFILIFGALGYFIVKKGSPAFRARANVIAGAIETATAAKQEANQQLRVAEAGLARLDQDAATMRTQAERDFVAEADRLRTSSKREVEKIAHMAEVEIDAAARLAQIELRTAAARVAVARAAELVAQGMTPERREIIFQNFLDNLSKSRDGESPRGAN
jgi:F0F1-type ATP synthase membrane subunit b/b'